jgi:hypothetical protein
MAHPEPAPFDEETLLAEARRKTGLEDFGDDAFREPLRVLLGSLAEAPLNAVGVAVLRASLRRSLTQRLRAEDWFARHPEIAAEPIERPLVVVGLMRSGTTLIQRLLARDPRIIAALGWEIAEPAPRAGTRWDAPDPRVAAGEARSRQMREFAPALHAIHPTDAHEPDEEIVFLADAFLSHVPEASCDVPAYRAWIDTQDFRPAYRHLRRMLQLLQWQKRRRGERGERWVLKTPAHLGYLETLFAEFPDAHVIFTHRSPLATVPSGASLNATLWGMYADDVDPAVVGRQWLERTAWAMRRALAARDRMGEGAGRFCDVWFGDAVRDPLAEIGRIGAAVGLGTTADARNAMAAWLAADAGAARPAHRYAARDFGLDESAILEAFRDYMERFIDPQEPPA